MGVLGKLRPPEQAAPGSAGPPRDPGANLRHSNGLKDFLWLMPEVEAGRLLDLGPVAQATVTFFTDRGFRLTTEDLVRSWAEFESERTRKPREISPSGRPSQGQADRGGPARGGNPIPPEQERSPAELAAAFLLQNLDFTPESFHGILAWDAFDFLETELLAPLAARLYKVLAPGGVLLAAFHDSMEVEPMSYRVRDHETLELVPTRHGHAIRRALQNREILALFSEFRSSRTYVGRDHLREALFLK